MDSYVLICDDNIAVHKSLECYLAEDNINMVSVYDGESALKVLQSKNISLVVLDVMLPKKNGLDVLRDIRKTMDTPVIMLSAKGSDVDRIVGLELGADDYVVKPFSPREVTLRIRKLLARSNSMAETKKLRFAELTIDVDSYEAFINGRSLGLTAKEVELLSYLVYNAGKVLSREIILNAVWGYNYVGDTRSVDAQIKRLRQKLPKENIHFAIKSIYGVGYKMEMLT